jgi:hypothetical protein
MATRIDPIPTCLAIAWSHPRIVRLLSRDFLDLAGDAPTYFPCQGRGPRVARRARPR